jgi:hypothetical protein
MRVSQSTEPKGERLVDPDPVVQRPLWQRYALLRFLCSVWLGVVLLVVIVLFASIVSALPQVRGAIEMTEMQVFRHWVFVSLVALFMLSLLATTFLRQRWDALHAGGAIVHIGLIVMLAGTWWYFGTKVEGDVVLLSPRVEVLGSAGQRMGVLGRFLAAPGESWSGAVGGQRVAVQVTEVEAEGLQPAATVRLAVQVGEQPAETVELSRGLSLRDFAQQGFVVRLGTFEPVNAFYDDEMAAVVYRNLTQPEAGRRQAAVPGLPWYRERYVDLGYALQDQLARPVPSKRTTPQLALGGVRIPTGWFEHWRMPIDVPLADAPFDVEVRGYLPYVSEDTFDIVTSDGRRIRRDEASNYDPAELTVVPRVVPVEMRRPNMGRSPSAILLDITGKGELADWSVSRWVLYSPYPHIDASPIRITLPDNSTWELLYTRLERTLSAQLAGERLSVEFFPGRQRVKSWRSDFLAELPGQPVQHGAVYTNQTYTLGRLTLFQSGAATDHWSWTILGVGNRRGIWPMVIGSVLITLGCLYAFYVKPFVLRSMLKK